jgi:hypothetical protein
LKILAEYSGLDASKDSSSSSLIPQSLVSEPSGSTNYGDGEEDWDNGKI